MTRPDDWRHDHEVGRADPAPGALSDAARDTTHDATRVDDVRIEAVRPLISPALLQDEMPLPPRAQALVEGTRAALSDVLAGRDDRLIVVVGPCSIHDHDQALEYARHLKAAADELADDLLMVMRVYFEKPRTTVGWKGYINDPRLDGSFRINEGLRRARQLLLEVAEIGLPAGTEFLDLLSAAVHRRPHRLGRHRRAHHRKPEPPPAGLGPVLPGGLQERHRRQHQGGGRRGASRARSAARLHGHDQDGRGGDLRDPRQRRLPCHPARRQGAQLRRRPRGGQLATPCGPPACASR